MANCHKLLSKYNVNLNVKRSKKNRLRDAKEALREKIRKYFAEHHPDYVPYFYIQGSYKMGTMIRTKDDECDLDDGVYFFVKPEVEATTLQKWVYHAVDGHTQRSPQHRKKCIRVIYAGDFHIDLPVYYYRKDEDTHPWLAVKNQGWEQSDPKEFIAHYKDVKAEKTDQLTRVSRYLKSWCDYKRHNMPSGLIMAVMASVHLTPNDRDDFATLETLRQIRTALQNDWSCIMPTTPGDDLLARYDETFKKNFFIALDAFIKDAEEALEVICQEKASKLWRKHFGTERFPLGEALDEEARSIDLAERQGALTISASGSSDYTRMRAKSKGGVYGD